MLYADLFASEPRTEREAPIHHRDRNNQFVLTLFASFSLCLAKTLRAGSAQAQLTPAQRRQCR